MKLFIRFIIFSVTLINIVTLLYTILITKLLLFLNKKKLAKNFWVFTQKLIIKKNNIYSLYSNYFSLKNYIFNLLIIFILTFFFYSFFILIIDFINIDIEFVNRAMLLIVINFFILCFILNDQVFEEFFELNFDDINYESFFDYDEFMWDELFLEFPVDESNYYDEEFDQVEELDDFFHNYDTNPSQNFDMDSNVIQNHSNYFPKKYSFFLKQDDFIDDIYLFERWSNLSNEILKRFYFNKKLIKLDTINIKNRYKIIEFEFLKYSKFLFFRPIYFKFINSKQELQKLMMQNFILHNVLSDSLVYYINYYSYHAKRRDISFWGKNSFTNNFVLYNKKKPFYYRRFKYRRGARPYRFYQHLHSSKFIFDYLENSSNYFFFNSYNSNYNNFIFGTDVHKHIGSITNFFDYSSIIGFNYNYIFLNNEINLKINYNINKLRVNPYKNLKFKGMDISFDFNKESFYFMRLFRKLHLKGIDYSFQDDPEEYIHQNFDIEEGDLELYFIIDDEELVNRSHYKPGQFNFKYANKYLYYLPGPVLFKTDEEKEVVYNVLVHNTKYWLKFNTLYDKLHIEHVISNIVMGFVKKFLFIDKQLTIQKQLKFIEHFIDTEYNLFFNSPFFIKKLKKYQKFFEFCFYELVDDFIDDLGLAHLSLIKKRFSILILNRFYKSLLPEQFFFIPHQLRFKHIKKYYKSKTLNLNFFLPSHSNSHLGLFSKNHDIIDNTTTIFSETGQYPRDTLLFFRFFFNTQNSQPYFYRRFNKMSFRDIDFFNTSNDFYDFLHVLLEKNTIKKRRVVRKLHLKKKKLMYLRQKIDNFSLFFYDFFFISNKYAMTLFYDIPLYFSNFDFGLSIKLRTKMDSLYYKFIDKNDLFAMHNDLFTFPYLNDLAKIKYNEKNYFIDYLKNFNYNILDCSQYQFFSGILNYKLIQRLSQYENNIFITDFLLTLDLAFRKKKYGLKFNLYFKGPNSERYIDENDCDVAFDNLILNKLITTNDLNSCEDYNLLIYKSLFISNILNQSKFQLNQFNIKNFKNYKYTLLNYYYLFFFEVFHLNFIETGVTDFKFSDYEILSNLGNRLWFMSPLGNLKYIFLRESYTRFRIKDKSLRRAYNMPQKFIKSRNKATLKSFFRSFMGNEFHRAYGFHNIVSSSYFDWLETLKPENNFYIVNHIKIKNILDYIDRWLHSDNNEIQDDSFEFGFFFFGFFFLWIFHQYYFISFLSSIDDKEQLWNIIELNEQYDEYTDAWKSTLNEILVSTFFNEYINDTNFVGAEQGLFENNYGTSGADVFRGFLEETYSSDEYVFIGKPPVNLKLDFMDEFTKNSYFINQLAEEFEIVEGYLYDFFRYGNSRSNQIYLKNILKWYYYGKLNNSINFLNKNIFFYLNFKKLKYKKQIPIIDFFFRKKIKQPSFKNKRIAYKKLNLRIKFKRKTKKKINQLFFYDKVFYNTFMYNNLNHFFNKFEKKLFFKYFKHNKYKRNILYKNMKELDRTEDKVYDRFENLAYVDDLLTFFKSEIKHKSTVDYQGKLEGYTDQLDDLEDDCAHILNVFGNLDIYYKQQYFYNLFEKHYFFNSSINYLPLNYINKFLLKPIFKSITQYGDDLNEAYSDAFDYIPKYSNFFKNLSPFLKKELINNLPDYYNLVFTDINIFKNEPYLNNKSLWYEIFYKGPYKHLKVKPKLDNLLFIIKNEPYLFDALSSFFYNTYNVERWLDGAIDLNFELARESIKKDGAIYDLEYANETIYLDLDQLLNIRSFIPTEIREKSEFSKSFLRLCFHLSKRRIIFDYFTRGFDKNINLGFYSYKHRQPWWNRKTYSDFIYRVHSFVTKHQLDFYGEYLNNAYSELYSIIDTNDHIKYLNRFNKKNIKISKYRNFNNNTYKEYLYDDLFNYGARIIENRFILSDRLFENPTNYNLINSLTRTHIDYIIAQDDYNDYWYDLEEYIIPEADRMYNYNLTIWPQLVRSVLDIPKGTPPLIWRDMISNVITLSDYIVKNKYFINKRYKDPVHDEDPLEVVQIVAEEGALTQKIFVPVYIYFFDISLMAFNIFNRFFKNIFILELNRNFFGSGNYNFRPIVYKNNINRNYLNNLNSINHYDFKHIKNHYVFFNDLPFFKVFFTLLDELEEFFFPFYSNFFYNIRIYLNLIIIKIETIFNFFKKIYFKYIRAVIDSTLLNTTSHFGTIAFFLIFMYYIFWLPFLSLIAVLRFWLFYPVDNEEPQTGLQHNEEIYFGTGNALRYNKRYKHLKEIPESRTGFLNGRSSQYLNDSGLTYFESDVGNILSDSIVTLYADDLQHATDGLIDINTLNYVQKSELIDYCLNLNLVLVNELIYLNNINIPGYKFTYNLTDILQFSEYDFNFSKNKTPLPYFSNIFIEYLTLLTGYQANIFDNLNELTTQSKFKRRYFRSLTRFNKTKISFLLKKKKIINFDIVKLNEFNLKKFVIKNKNRLKKKKNFYKFKRELLFYNETNRVEYINENVYRYDRGEKLQKPFRKKKVAFKLKKNYRLNIHKSLNFITKSKLITKDFSFKYPLKTIWFSNKNFYKNLDLLNISLNIIISNDFFNNLLYSEKYLTILNKNNLLINTFSINSWFFLSKNSIIKTQYKPGERILPFYLRFNRNYFDFNKNDLIDSSIYDQSEDFFSNLNINNQEKFSIFKNTNSSDFLFIQPFNDEGLINYEFLFTFISHTKMHFKDLLIKQELNNFDNLLIDLHNIELNNFFSKPIIYGLNSLKSFYYFSFRGGKKRKSIKRRKGLIQYRKQLPEFNTEDWFFLIEETKNWTISLFNNQFIGTYPAKSRRLKRKDYREYNLKLFYLNHKYQLRRFYRKWYKTALKYRNRRKYPHKYYAKRRRRIPLKVAKRYRQRLLRYYKHLYKTQKNWFYFYKDTTKSTSNILTSGFFIVYRLYNAARLMEKPNFPDNSLSFSTLLQNNPEQQIYKNNFFLKSQYNSELINNDIFCQLVANQYIDIFCYFDIYSILTPEGRAINKRFSLQSSLQMYSYLNYNFNIKRVNVFFNIVNFNIFFNFKDLKLKKYYKQKIFLIIKILLFILLCIILFNI
jgi:hypothetical protein